MAFPMLPEKPAQHQKSEKGIAGRSRWPQPKLYGAHPKFEFSTRFSAIQESIFLTASGIKV
jgi:hypothetical protein